MADPLLIRQKQVLRKEESTKGTAEALVAADGGIRILVDSGFEVNEPTNPRDVARSTLTQLGYLSGEKSGTITVRSEMNTNDSITSTDLEYEEEFRGCGCTVLEVKTNTIGTQTGNFVRGETVQDASANQGVVIAPADAGDANIYYRGSASLQDAEGITGLTSGAIASTTSAAYVGGQYVKPQSEDPDTLTYELQEDGYAWTIKGAMGNFTATMEASRAGIFEFVMNGVKSSYGDKAFTSGITYQTEQPPILQGAELTINSVGVCFQSATLDMGNNVVPRVCGNETNGILHYYISSRDAKLTISFEHLAAATLDTFGLLSAGTKVPIAFRVGTTATKTIWVFADLAQVTSISAGDADGIRTLDVEFTLTGAANSEDDELEIVFV